MATKNHNSQKTGEWENRTGQNMRKDVTNHKLPDNSNNNPEELVSSHGDTSNSKYSKPICVTRILIMMIQRLKITGNTSVTNFFKSPCTIRYGFLKKFCIA